MIKNKQLYKQESSEGEQKASYRKELAGYDLKPPIYAPVITKLNDFNALRELNNRFDLENVQAYQMPFLSAKELRDKRQSNLKRFTGQKEDAEILDDKLLIVDPQFDYLKHKVADRREKMLEFEDLPETLEAVFEGEKSYSELYQKGNEGELSSAIEWSMEKQMEVGADFPLPPCPPIEGKGTLKRAFRTNKISNAVATSEGYQKSLYFNIDSPSKLQDKKVKNGIVKYAGSKDIDTVYIKIRRPSAFKTSISRKHYVEMIRALSRFNKDVFILNTNTIGYISLGLGAYGFSEPVHGSVFRDIRSGGTSTTVRGKYLHPKKLEWWKYDEQVKEYLSNNGNHLPCYCEACRNARNLNFDNHAGRWNKLRRKHAVLARNEHVSEFKENLAQGNVRGAMFDRLNRHTNSEFIQWSSFFE